MILCKMSKTTHVRIPKHEHELLKEIAEKEEEDMAYVVAVLVDILHRLKFPESPAESGYSEMEYWEEMGVVMLDSDKLIEISSSE